MEIFTGALVDNRPEEEKAKDWHKDVAGGLVEFQTKRFEDIKTFPVRNQDGSSTCVMQTCALMCGIENYLEEGRFIEFSVDLYNERINKGTGGMVGVDALNLLKKVGLTLEVLIPSMNMGESAINSLPARKVSDNEIAKIFRIKDYYQLKYDISAIAQIMENGRKNGVAKPIMVWFEFPRSEWDSKPQLSGSNYDMVRHSVTAVDFGIVDGKKGLFIQDSWGLDATTVKGLRFISEDYIKARMIFCAYVNDLDNAWQNDKINNTVTIPTSVLRIGSKGEDVKKLQGLLGLKQDGIFGAFTWQTLRKFQLNNGLSVDGICGKNTWIKLLSK